jgi:hypothetical protein
MIVDAMNEASFIYTGAGTSNCGQATKPVVRYATQAASAPTSKVMDLGLTAELKRAFPRPWSHPPIGPMANGASSV